MSKHQATPGGLALYKIRPALIVSIGDKIDIELEGGKSKRVRSKDITILHPGPLVRLSDLGAPGGDVLEAWELLDGGETDLQELADLVYGGFTPSTAWAAWQLVVEGLYFQGTPEKIIARNAEQVARDLQEREARIAAEQEWDALLERLKKGVLDEGDRDRLQEVEKLAAGAGEYSKILKALAYAETPQSAHRFLLGLGYWDERYNPHPRRQSLPLDNPQLDVPALPEEERLDLTHLQSFAIDDEGSNDPDDAISLDGDRIWVHVADVAALVDVDSPLDMEARGRAANLYLPEGVAHMLPTGMTDHLGLGLQETSPALSFGFRLDDAGQPVDIEVQITRIKVSRLTYAEADRMMDEPPFGELNRLAEGFRARREAAGAINLDLPEASVRVSPEGEIQVRPMARLGSRALVTNMMLMAGEAAARFSLIHEICIPFATQPAPDSTDLPEGIAASYAFRRKLKPSTSKTLEAPHAGLGLELYTRATSPLRRYLDLVTHQQLRRHLRGKPTLEAGVISERIGAAEAVSGAVRRGERLSNSHWKLLYLQANPQWQGEGVVVDMKDKRATIIVPELALESRIRLRKEVPLETRLNLMVREIDLPELVVWFRVVD
ncbi:MAG: RNB domain-containing ribonuclease [Gammaproteobacteria bacterium]|nr:RNB domain-containing ribonuclease [Gammaproteobacteria bacterium]